MNHRPFLQFIRQFSKFIDRCALRVQAGKGGNGSGSFARDNWNPRGKCDGGNGGDGGNVFLMASNSVNNLCHIKKFYCADSGVSGASNGKYGMKGSDLTIPVPSGTVVFSVGEDGKRVKLGDCDREGDQVLVAKGGTGGRGNRSLRTNNETHESGQLGEEVRLELDMNTIADIGLVGLPNAGKSSLLAAISRSSPQIAPYPFTTLTPNVGVSTPDADNHDFKLCIADIPGLIDGAHKNVGLGHEFLKHVIKNRHLALVLDLSLSNPIADAQTIIRELDLYQVALSKKIKFVIGNKIDKLTVEAALDIVENLQVYFPGNKVIAISARELTGIDKLQQELKSICNKV